METSTQRPAVKRTVRFGGLPPHGATSRLTYLQPCELWLRPPSRASIRRRTRDTALPGLAQRPTLSSWDAQMPPVPSCTLLALIETRLTTPTPPSSPVRWRWREECDGFVKAVAFVRGGICHTISLTPVSRRHHSYAVEVVVVPCSTNVDFCLCVPFTALPYT